MKNPLMLKFFPALATGIYAMMKVSANRKGKVKRGLDKRVNEPLAGQVKNRKQDKSYVYLQVAANDGDWWVGVQSTEADVGDRVKCVPYRMIAAYDSAELLTAFEKMYFADEVVTEQKAAMGES